MMREIAYKFDYSSKEDSVTFSFRLGLQAISLTLKADAFFELCDDMAASSAPLFERIRRRKAGGTEEDVEFDTEAWEKLMDTGKEQER